MQPMFIQFHQFCMFACQKRKSGLNCKEKRIKLKEIKSWSQRTQTRPTENVVGHDFVPRKSSSQREREKGRGNVVLHDIPSYSTTFFGFDGGKKTREKCRSPRLSSPRPTEFFGRDAITRTIPLYTTFYPKKFVPHDIQCRKSIYTWLSRGFWSFKNQLANTQTHGERRRGTRSRANNFVCFLFLFL